jgi:hypothetical protein
MNTAYSTFTGRRRAAGKPFYGMTAENLKRLNSVREDNSLSLSCHAENLFTFAGIYIQHARDLAKSGFKDEARNWYRFFNNAKIVSVLGELKVTGDVAKLREELNLLGLECHPMEPGSFTTDIEAIRSCLTEILSHVKKTPRKTKTVRQLDNRRAVNRLHGHG